MGNCISSVKIEPSSVLNRVEERPRIGRSFDDISLKRPSVLPKTDNPRIRAKSPSVDFSKYIPSIRKDTFISSRKDFSCLLCVESNPDERGSIKPCRLTRGGCSYVLVTQNVAIKFFIQSISQDRLERIQKKNQTIVDKTCQSDEEIGLVAKKSIPFEDKIFSVYLPLKGETLVVGKPWRVEEAFLEDCSKLKISTKEELSSFFACVVHQVDAFHKANVCHMDIKLPNICKTKNNLFKIIDVDGSLDFDENAQEDIKKTRFDFTPSMTPSTIFHRLQKANTVEETKQIAKRMDVFAIGSVFYQMTHALKMEISGVSRERSIEKYPYELEKQEFCQVSTGKVLLKALSPWMLKMPNELNETLSVIDDLNQRNLIKRMISFNFEGQPTTAELKEAFPSSFIVKK